MKSWGHGCITLR